MNGSLYVHIPFCTKKCDYCHFYVIPESDERERLLLDALADEWKLRTPLIQDWNIVSLYFGGGTPSLLTPDAICSIIDRTRPLLQQNAEITLEANPETISEERIRRFADSGVNRVSIGLQSLDDSLLKTLSRTHTADKAKRAVHETYNAGIENITVDLMYDLPGQTLEQWQKTLDEAVQLPIKHLSLYNLTFEPHTVFYKKRETLLPMVPDEPISAEMYRAAVQTLEDAGLQQYEISAFAQNGYRSRHNTGYWSGRPFIGFGPSAFSYCEGRRFRNVANLNTYAKTLKEGKDPVDFDETLAPDARSRELLTIGLRVKEGVPLATLTTLDPETLASIETLIRQGFLVKEEPVKQADSGTLRLTEKGILFYDTVAAELI